MDRLNPLDAQFVNAEDGDRNASMAIASIAVFEGPPPSYEEFLEALAGRLPLVPRYRHRLRTVPFRIGPPVWVEDPNFDLRYHVRYTALPAPGRDEELRHLMALLGRIDIGRLANFSLRRFLRDFANLVERHSKNCRHRAHADRHGFLHVLAAIANRPHRVGKGQRACGHVRRILAQAASGNKMWAVGCCRGRQ